MNHDTKNTGYACSVCKASALVVNGKLIRSCEHSAPVLADMTATVSQHGGVSLPQPQRV
jgi:hypothetical protein